MQVIVVVLAIRTFVAGALDGRATGVFVASAVGVGVLVGVLVCVGVLVGGNCESFTLIVGFENTKPFADK